MKLFRTAKKEYDGPAAASASSGGGGNGATPRHHLGMTPIPQKHRQQVSQPRSVSSSGGGGGRGTVGGVGGSASRPYQPGMIVHCSPNDDNISIASSVSGSITSRHRHVVFNPAAPNNNCNNNNNNNSSRRRHSGTDATTPLASGESSRRRGSTATSTTGGVGLRRHSANIAPGGNSSTSSNINNNHRRPLNNTNFLDASERSTQSGNTSVRSPQIPMEHDGGILCVTPVPDTYKHNNNNNSSSSNRRNNKYNGGYDGGTTHRFLSGGIDGTVKLWEVYEPPSSHPNYQDALTPRLVKTYKGHKGYVHSIAVLGSFDPFEGVKFDDDYDDDYEDGSDYSDEDDSRYSQDSNNDWEQRQRRRRKGNRSGGGGGISGRRQNGVVIATKRIGAVTNNNLQAFLRKNTNGSSGSNPNNANINLYNNNNNPNAEAMAEIQRQKLLQKQLKQWGGRRSKDLFVTASRDNTLRIWEIDNTALYNEHDACFDNHHHPGEDGDEMSANANNQGVSPILATGKKLRGHEFGTNVNGGVLCVCAIPSMKTSEDDGTAAGRENNSNSNGDSKDTISAGQFASGGADGVVRIWDVRSALFSLGKVPKAGMYGTVCLQSLHPNPVIPNNGHSKGKTSKQKNQQHGARPVPITSIVCTGGGSPSSSSSFSEEYGLFAADANGTIRRYSPMNECGDGHVNGAIWWGCSGIFHGHKNTISSMALISSTALISALSPSDKNNGSNNNNTNNNKSYANDNKVGTMLLSSSNDGSIRVWDAFDSKIKAKLAHLSEEKKSMLQRVHLWEIELNDRKPSQDNQGGSTTARSNYNSHHALDGGVGVTSLATLDKSNLMAAGTTDGAIRMWNVATGLYEGAYNVGKSVQVWSLAVLTEQDGRQLQDGRVVSSGILVSGDNRGRIRILRKTSTQVMAVRGGNVSSDRLGASTTSATSAVSAGSKHSGRLGASTRSESSATSARSRHVGDSTSSRSVGHCSSRRSRNNDDQYDEEELISLGEYSDQNDDYCDERYRRVNTERKSTFSDHVTDSMPSGDIGDNMQTSYMSESMLSNVVEDSLKSDHVSDSISGCWRGQVGNSAISSQGGHSVPTQQTRNKKYDHHFEEELIPVDEYSQQDVGYGTRRAGGNAERANSSSSMTDSMAWY